MKTNIVSGSESNDKMREIRKLKEIDTYIGIRKTKMETIHRIDKRSAKINGQITAGNHYKNSNALKPIQIHHHIQTLNMKEIKLTEGLLAKKNRICQIID